TLRETLSEAQQRSDDLSDRNWELKEAEERARSFLETQGDVIVRRDARGRITYVNDAFCAIAQHTRIGLIGTTYAPAVLEQSEAVTLADGTRCHDQKIATPLGARWLAWREVMVRAETESRAEVQSVGRDVTDRVAA